MVGWAGLELRAVGTDGRLGPLLPPTQMVLTEPEPPWKGHFTARCLFPILRQVLHILPDNKTGFTSSCPLEG